MSHIYSHKFLFLFIQKFLFLYIQKNIFILVNGVSEQDRIIGGTRVGNIKDYPYMASFQYKSSLTDTFCGGTIINRFWILTAAHCLRKDGELKEPRQLVVVVGLVSFPKFIPRRNKYYIRKLVPHNKYNHLTSRYDIGLVKLKKKLKFSDKIQPIKLPNKKTKNSTSDFSKSECVALGWGVEKDDENLDSSRYLKIVTLRVIDYKECAKYYHHGKKVTANMICTYYEGGGRDTCQGDSGGPLLCDKRMIGITSWGHGCAKPKWPGVYTRVDHYLNWIEKVKSYQISVFVNYLLISATLIII